MAKRDLTRVDKNGLTEEEYLRGYNSDKFPKPSLTADIVIFRGEEVLLIRRGGHPYLGCWATPGGFAEKNEELINTARRELEEETGYRADDISLLLKFTSAIAYSTEVIDIYVAKGLYHTEAHPDEDEFIDVVAYSTDELKKMIFDGTIMDSKTIAGVMAYIVKEGEENGKD